MGDRDSPNFLGPPTGKTKRQWHLYAVEYCVGNSSPWPWRPINARTIAKIVRPQRRQLDLDPMPFDDAICLTVA